MASTSSKSAGMREADILEVSRQRQYRSVVWLKVGTGLPFRVCVQTSDESEFDVEALLDCAYDKCNARGIPLANVQLFLPDPLPTDCCTDGYKRFCKEGDAEKCLLPWTCLTSLPGLGARGEYPFILRPINDTRRVKVDSSPPSNGLSAAVNVPTSGSRSTVLVGEVSGSSPSTSPSLMPSIPRNSSGMGSQKTSPTTPTRLGAPSSPQTPPKHPRRPEQAFNLYCKENNPVVRRNKPNMSTVELNSYLVDRWNYLPPELRQVYAEKAKNEEARYQNELASYKARKKKLRNSANM